MAFLNPAAFYLLGIIPIVLALHFLKLRRQRYVVPSMLLWRASAEDQKANVPFQRLRNLLLPIIQSLILLLIVTSVARPALQIPGIIHGKIIYIVDNSASMLSRELGETRLALAKQEVLKHINQVSASGGVMIMASHVPKPYILQTFTTDTMKLRYAVDNIVPTHKGDASTSVFDYAFQYADSTHDQIFFISDSTENIEVNSVPINKIQIGGDADNIGIVKFSVERIADQFNIFAGIQNYTDTSREIETRLELEGGIPIDEKTLSLQADEVKSILFKVNTEDRLDDVVISLNLVDVEDDFELDNRAWAILKPKNKFRFLLVSNRNLPFLNELLRSYGDQVELQTVSTDEFHTTGDADVVIYDRASLSEQVMMNITDTQNAIFINWQSEMPFLSESTVEVIRTPVRVIREHKTHPIMQGISIMGMQVKESIHRSLPIWAESLIETEKGSLVWLGEDSGRHYLVFEFDVFNPEHSIFTTTIPDAPLLIYHSLAWFKSRNSLIKSLSVQSNVTGQSFRTGENLRVGLTPEETLTVKVKKPDNTLMDLDSDVITDTDQIGIYSIFVEDTPFGRFAVNLLDENESDLSLSSTESKKNEQIDATDRLQPITREVWQWVVLFAVGLLLCEWWFYHRT